MADIFEHQIMLMNNLRNFPPVTLGIFQSTLLQEERLKLKYIQNGNSYFNPRSYKRSDFYQQTHDIVTLQFQSTLLQEERLLCHLYVLLHCQFQSTLLQEERHESVCGRVPEQTISIHAPTRGATFWKFHAQ